METSGEIFPVNIPELSNIYEGDELASLYVAILPSSAYL